MRDEALLWNDITVPAENICLRGECGSTMKYRSRSEIMAKVLEISMTGVSRARIMGRARISYEQIDGYLELLKEQDLIYESGKHFYRVTEKGIKFLSRSCELNELMFLPKSRRR